jgi:hypothetical protein
LFLMTAPSSSRDLPPDRFPFVGGDDELTEFSPERGHDPLFLRDGDQVRLRLPVDPGAVIGLDDPIVPGSAWARVARGAALVLAGLGLGALAVGVFPLPTLGSRPVAPANLRPPPRAETQEVPPAPASPGVVPDPPRTAAPVAPPPQALPSAAPPPAVSTPVKPQSDRRAIQLVLDRYLETFNGLDAKDGARTENQRVAFEDCAVEIRGDRAEAACRGTARYVPRVGNAEPRIEGRQWTFGLRNKPDGGWVIDQVEAR